jgi:hypothetical protein
MTMPKSTVVWSGFRNAKVPFAFRAPRRSLKTLLEEQILPGGARLWYEAELADSGPGKATAAFEKPRATSLLLALHEVLTNDTRNPHARKLDPLFCWTFPAGNSCLFHGLTLSRAKTSETAVMA